MEFLTGGPVLAEALTQSLRQADLVRWVVFDVERKGWDVVCPAVSRLLERDNAQFHLIVYWNGQPLPTTKAAEYRDMVATLKGAGKRASLRLWKPDPGIMHVKLYTSSRAGVLSSVLVGSNNLTGNALERNTEAAVLETQDIPEDEITSFLASAMNGSRVCDDSFLDENTETPPPDPPPDDPFRHLSIAHLRLSFGLTRVYLSPKECGLDLLGGTSTSQSAGPLTFRTSSSLSYDLLDLQDSAGVLREIKSIRRRLDPKTPQWALRYRYLETSLGMVVPFENRASSLALIEKENRALRKATNSIDGDEIRGLLKKRLPKLAKELTKKLEIRSGQRETIAKIQEGIMSGATGVLKHLKRSLRVHLILHGLPTFQENNADERVSFSVEMSEALFHLLGLVASHKSSRNLGEHLNRLYILNQAANSATADALITRLGKARIPSQRRDIANRATQLKIERLSWHGLSPSERRRRVERDRQRRDMWQTARWCALASAPLPVVS